MTSSDVDPAVTQQYVLAFDVGGTDTKFGFVGRDGSLFAQRTVPTPRGGAESLVRGLRSVYKQVISEVESGGFTFESGHVLHSSQLISTIGVAVPGVLDEVTGYTQRSANLGWGRFPMRDALSAAFSAPVVLCHDVRSGAVGETYFRGLSDALFVAIGTGISAGIVLNGSLLQGGGLPGEIGQVQVVNPDIALLKDLDLVNPSAADFTARVTAQKSCCADMIAMERVSSAEFTAQRYCRLRGEKTVSLASKDVFVLEGEGDPLAHHVIETGIVALADVLAAASAILGSIDIIIGGGQAKEGKSYLWRVEETVAARLVNIPVPNFSLAHFGSTAQLRGVGAQVFASCTGN